MKSSERFEPRILAYGLALEFCSHGYRGGLCSCSRRLVNFRREDFLIETFSKSRESTSRMDVSKKASNIHLQVSKACSAENKRILALSSVRLPLRVPKERECTVENKRVPSFSSPRYPPLVLSPPRELPAPSPNVICPYCKREIPR